ncbi:DNA polymerase III subunit gamma/tau [Leucothrix arctica]|uniref:DNA polymerase III subunit gamma/tau n=1 Tax=Leucothrix arctica TaxID=1481894 RepID=A0A317C610_9GAMM|nr:DNA polymerase III subunit gamma/tau [Leucothrix arctica]PWQ93699.1 DNA polymerase III subunit gamma/tau [Leucothrix arctica]
MSYQVLARKWRPQNFKEMVGQQHVLRGLINALDNDRLHHAYLFTGTRGVGKTTIARILAKCLNCETGITSEPCGECGACKEIASGRFVDLIEVDAASRTKVEDTRELLDNVQYAPTHGRFKVYLIDEVHMLSGHSFNALLKTLEEPPEHVKFLFATTDPQKLPVTILSRCLQFNLKRMTMDMIANHLQHLVTEESIKADDPALRLLARAADGSMRDALSLMDQAIAFGNGNVEFADVQEMLGSIAHDPLIEMIKMVASGDGAGIINKVEDMAGVTPDFAAATDAMISMLHQMAVLQVVDGADEDNDNLRELAQQLSKEDVQLYYQIAITGRRDLSLALDPRSGFEMLLLRMLAFRPTNVAPVASQTITDATKSDEIKKKTLGSKVSAETLLPAPAPAPAPTPTPVQTPPPEPKVVPTQTVQESSGGSEWDEYDQMVNSEPVSKAPDTHSADSTISTSEVQQPPVSPQSPTPPPWGDAPATNETIKEPTAKATDPVEQVIAKSAEPITPVDNTQPIKQAVELAPEVNLESKAVDIKEMSAHSADEWYGIVKALPLTGRAAALAQNCVLAEQTEDRIEIHLESASEMLMSSGVTDEIEAALNAHFGTKRTLVVAVRELNTETPAQYNDRYIVERQKAVERHINEDSFVLKLAKEFDAKVVPGSVKPKSD